jgi:hypothetical protein
VPLDPDVMVIQSEFAPAVHAHPAATVTDTVPVPPFASNASDAGATVESHDGGGGGPGGPGAACPCVIVIVCPATRTVPVRDAPLLAATFSVATPLPLPLDPSEMAIHAT